MEGSNPQIIMVSMSAMGQTGPWKDYVAFGPTLQALSGLTYLSSFDDDRPLGPGHAYCDHVMGLYGALAVLAALENRSRTGCGECVDLSGYEAACSVMGDAILDASLKGIPAGRRGNHPNDHACPSGCYRCRGADRWCVVSAATDDEWQALCRVTGYLDLLDDDRYRTAPARRSNEASLDALIGRWTAGRTAEEAVALLQEAGVPAGIVQNAEDLATDPHLAARCFFVPLEHPVLGRTIHDRSPIRCEGDETVNWKAAPQLGEDNRYVFRELLGLTEEEFLQYRDKGIIA
jgi:crotonobetainyl-CoA:carnitine CoA-transferase CaiB-like acyl-CoA transferase